MTCGRARERLPLPPARRAFRALAFAAVVVAAFAAHAADQSTQPARTAYRVINDEALSFERVRHGMSKFDVYIALGVPTARLTAEVWIYDGCRLENDPDGKSPFDTMVMEFAHDRLVRMKMVEGRALRAALAKNAKAPPGETVAARK